MRKRYHQYRTSAFTENRALCGAEGFEDDTPWPLSHRLRLCGKQTHREGLHPLSAELEAPSQSRKQLAPRGGPERKASEAWVRSHSERPRTSESEKITNNCEKNKDSNLVGPEDSRASAAGEGGHAAI